MTFLLVFKRLINLVQWLQRLTWPLSRALSRLSKDFSYFTLVKGCCLIVLIVNIPHKVLVVVLQLIYESQ